MSRPNVLVARLALGLCVLLGGALAGSSDPEVAKAEATLFYDGPIDLATPGVTFAVGR